MAQRRSLGSITKKASGAWLVRVTVPTAGGGQKRKSKTVRGSKRDAEKVLQALLAEQGISDGGMTFGQFVELHYAPWHDSEYTRPSSVKKFGEKMRRLLSDFSDTQLSAMTRPVMETWAASQPEHKVNAMKAALAKAVAWEMIARNPLSDVKPHRSRPSKERLSAEDASRMVEALRGSDIEALVLVMLMGGLRKGEALALDWTRIDFSTGMVTVDRGYHYEDGRGWFEEPKNYTSRRVVTLDRRTLDRLDEIRRSGGVVRLGAICEVRPGKRMPPNTVCAKWRAVARPVLGGRYVPIEKLRNTHASLALSSGVSMEAISKRLGHASVRLTESTYAEAPEIESQCADAMAQVFGA